MLELQLARAQVFDDLGRFIGYTWGIREWNSALFHPLKFKRTPRLRRTSKYKTVTLKWLKRRNPQKLDVTLTRRRIKPVNLMKYSFENSKEMVKLMEEFSPCEKKSEKLETIESWGMSYEL